MGLVKKILSQKKIPEESVFYSDYLSIELTEDFHIHLRNIRLECDHEEFEEIYKQWKAAYRRWCILGKPAIGDEKNRGRQIFLADSKLSSVVGAKNEIICSDEMRVELQKWTDYIHVHWKNLRFEFTVDEFHEFADVIGKAKQELQNLNEISTMPRREGTHHRACPRGRVDHKGDGEFWTEAQQDKILNDPHKTYFFHDADEDKKKRRHQEEKTNIKKYKHSLFSRIVILLLKHIKSLRTLLGIRIS